MEFNIENRMWIKKSGKTYLGQGRIQLLEAIESTGSIAKASETLGMSYKKAWSLIKAMNSIAEKPLVIKETGGKHGGGTQITEQGKKLILEFRRLEKKTIDFLDKESRNLRLV